MAKAWLRRWALIGALATAGSGQAWAAGASAEKWVEIPQDAPPIGGWAGAIGRYKVLVCLGTNGGSYLYARHPANPPLALSPQDNDGKEWRENEGGAAHKITGHWRLRDVAGDVLQGEWADPTGKRSLRIRLARVGEPGGCDFVALQHTVGLDPEKITAGKEAVSGGIHYRTLSALDDSVSTIELIDASGRYDALNKKLREALNGEIGEAEECQSDSSLRYGMLSWPYSSSVELGAMRGHWLTLRQNSEYYCGGAHPDGGSVLWTVDARSGETLNLADWLKQDKGGALPAKLDRMVARKAVKQRGGGEDDDCASVYTGGDDGRGDFPGYAIALGEHGLVFYKSLPHVVYACTEEVEIPFARLKPFLSKAGKAEVRRLEPVQAGKR